MKKKMTLQAATGAAGINSGPRTDSFSTDFSSRAQSLAGQDEMLGGAAHIRTGSINKMDLSIDIPVDKKADHNPNFKTPATVGL